MIRKAQAMFAKLFHTSAVRERPNPDPISAHMVIARQRNERASQNARLAIADLLDRNDKLKGSRQ